MSAEIIERKYTPLYGGLQLPFLIENAQGKVTAFIRFQNEYYTGSGVSNTFTTNGTAVTIQSGNWQDFIGIVAGSVIDFSFEDGATTLTYSRTVTDVFDDVFYINTALPSPYTGAVFPSGALSGMRISVNQAPASVEFEFNLCPSNNPSASSVIDGNVNRFKADNVDTLSVGGSLPMVQIGQFRSGGHIEDVRITLEDDNAGARGITRIFKIEYTFNQWGVVQSGYNEPNYYPLSPYHKVKNYIQNNNLDGVQIAEATATNGNTGGYNVNFNNGTNNYTLVSTEWFDYLGNPIDAPDYSNNCTFVSVVTAPDQSTTLSKYMIGCGWRPVDESRYQNKPDRLGEVLRWNRPDVVFNHSATADTTVYAGLTDFNERFDLTDIKFFVSGSTLTISGELQPVNMVSFFDAIPDGDRRFTLSIALSNHNLDADSSDRVELKLWDSDIIDAPTLGVQHPYVFNENLLDHGGINITDNSSGNTTTSDDVLYKSRFQLVKNAVYEGVRARIFVKNDITNEEFTLEDNFFDFSDTSNGIYVAGVHEYYKVINRNFLLPLASDRNLIKLKRSQNLDTPLLYGMEIQYGFLSRIESWIANPNVDVFFFDPLQPNSGLNQNWQRFTDGDWQLYVAYYPRKNGVDDFQVYNVKTLPFQNDPAFTFSPVLKTPSGTVMQGVDTSGDYMKVEMTVTYANNNYADEWFTLQLRNYKGAVVGYISSVKEYDTIVSPNVLLPLDGETFLKTTITGNVALLECKINTALIGVSKVTMIARVYTLQKGDPDIHKEFEDGGYVQFEDVQDYKEFIV